MNITLERLIKRNLRWDNMDLDQKITHVKNTMKAVQEKIDAGAHNELCIQDIANSLSLGLEIGRAHV